MTLYKEGDEIQFRFRESEPWCNAKVLKTDDKDGTCLIRVKRGMATGRFWISNTEADNIDDWDGQDMPF